MKRCNACGNEFPDDSKVCGKCGAVQTEDISPDTERMNIYLKQLAEDMAAQRLFEKKQLWHARLRSCLSVAAFLLFLAAVFAAVPTVNRILTNLNSLSDELAKVKFVEMTESVTTIAVEGTESIDYAMEELDTALTSLDEALDTVTAIDVEKLNQSIEDLSAIMKPLAALFGR